MAPWLTVEIIAAADGSALGNPGPSGWGWYVDADHWASGGWAHGTNNMGELMAVLDLLQQTAHLDAELHVLCDSMYVINSVTKWMKGWKRRGWKKGDGKPVLNVELMKALDLALQGRPVTFEWVKGHAGHPLNEQADRLANAAAAAFQAGKEPDAGPGWPGAAVDHPAAEVSQVEAEPDLFSDSTDLLSEAEVADSTDVAAPGGDSALAEVVAAERSLLSDQVRSDPAAVAALLHPDWYEVGASGRLWRRDDLLAAIGPLPTPTELEVITAELLDDHTALLLWRSHGSRTVLRTSVWIRERGRWLQRFHQGTAEV